MFSIAMMLFAAPLPPVDAAIIDDTGTITVTATRLVDLAAAAESCARDACPTRRDIAVTVAYASALFDAGNYHDSRRLLAAAVDRTRTAAMAEPLAISQFYNAQATLAAHEGDQDILRKATWASRNVLTMATKVPPLARITAEFRLADWQLRTGDRSGAEARYAQIIREATANAETAIADAARLRRAETLDALGRHAESAAMLEALAAQGEAGSAEVSRAALATAARLAFGAGDTSAANAFVSRLAASAPGAAPLLLSAPPLPRPAPPAVSGTETLIGIDRGPRGALLVGLRWVDIGFRIKPDGSVADVAVLRGSPRPDWARPLLGHISGRRYAAYAADTAKSIGVYRVERYTLTADYVTPIGSLVRRRGRNPRFEMMEMAAATPDGATN